jgi:hypothetical protein
VRALDPVGRAAAQKALYEALLVLGDLDRDAFEIVLPVPDGGLADAGGAVVAGPDPAARDGAPAPRRRLNRVKSASCGCH